MSERGRRIAAPALVVLAAVAVILALVAGYASRALFDPDQFADRAAAALSDEAVSAELATRVTDELVVADPNLVAVRPVMEEVLAGVIRSSAFAGLFRHAASDLHRAVFEHDANTVTMTIGDIGATARGALEAFNPKLAKQIPAKSPADVLIADPPQVVLDLGQVAEKAKPLPWVLLALAVLMSGGALWISPTRRTTALTGGVALGVGSVLVLVGLKAARALVLGSVESGGTRDSAAAIWEAFAGDLETALLLCAGCGAVIAAAASSLLRPVDAAAPLRRAWEFVTTIPERQWLRAVRAAALLVLGIVIVARHEWALELAAVLAGLYVAYAGAAELMRLSLSGGEEAHAEARRDRGVLAASAVVAVAILAAGALFIGVGGATEESLAIETVGCNGSEELCDLPYDEVAIPTTHNAMSGATYPGWLFAQQEKGLGDQLRDGIRGLAIDAHPGSRTNSGRIASDLSEVGSAGRERYAQSIGEEAFDAALRIRDRIVGTETGEPGVYLCHGFCELGAITIDKGLGEVRDFVAANPSEVVTIVIEDYVPPEEIAAAFERSGLDEYVYDGPLGEDGAPFPTLQEIIDSGGRVIVMAENDAGGGRYPWYRSAYESLLQETPYTFEQPPDLSDPKELPASCRPNRGPDDAPLFLINHWVDTSPAPRPSNAEKVNKRGVLERRIALCEKRRGLPANMISVDFYRQGDLFEVVADLNAARGADPDLEEAEAVSP